MKILNAFKWLYPGMWVKRWITLTVFGIIMISMGFVVMILEQSPTNKIFATGVLFLGITAFFVANALIAECIGGKIFSLEKLLGINPSNFTILVNRVYRSILPVGYYYGHWNLSSQIL